MRFCVGSGTWCSCGGNHRRQSRCLGSARREYPHFEDVLMIGNEFLNTCPNRLPPNLAGDSFATPKNENRYPIDMKTQLLAALALIGSTSFASAADITGKVVLKGTPPQEITIDMSTSPDKTCGAAHSTPVTTRHYLVGKDGGLANVLVYVKSGLEGKTFPAPTTTPMLDQVGRSE